MEISNNIQTRPSHSATKKCGLAAAALGAAGGAFSYGCAKIVTLPLRNDMSYANRAKFISDMTKIYEKVGLDMSKNTVSKAIKAGQKALKHPLTIAAGILLPFAAGCILGSVIDTVKNHKAKNK